MKKLIEGQAPDEIVADIQPTVPLSSKMPTDTLPHYFASRNIHRISYLQEQFPTISAIFLPDLFPLLDPLDLDLVLSCTIRFPDSLRKGRLVAHSLRPGPSFSVVETLRRDVEAAVAGGSKQTRTMYEETGRLRRVLIASVLDGCLGREEDPVEVTIKVGEDNGLIEHDFKTGYVIPLEWAFFADASCKCMQGPSGVYYPQSVPCPSPPFRAVLTIPVTIRPIYSF